MDPTRFELLLTRGVEFLDKSSMGPTRFELLLSRGAVFHQQGVIRPVFLPSDNYKKSLSYILDNVANVMYTVHVKGTAPEQEVIGCEI